MLPAAVVPGAVLLAARADVRGGAATAVLPRCVVVVAGCAEVAGCEAGRPAAVVGVRRDGLADGLRTCSVISGAGVSGPACWDDFGGAGAPSVGR